MMAGGSTPTACLIPAYLENANGEGLTLAAEAERVLREPPPSVQPFIAPVLAK